MSPAIYILCALTSLACACLLLQRDRGSRYRLLFWSGPCFCAMTVTNLLLVVDKLVLPESDWLALRHVSALAAVLLLLYGLIYEKDYAQ